MNDLNRKAFGGLLRLLISLAISPFLPAWTFDYWQAWVFLLAFFGSVLLITLYLVSKDPRLLQRRIHAGPRAEKGRSQKVIQLLAAIAFIVVFVSSAVDHRFAWSRAVAQPEVTHFGCYFRVRDDTLRTRTFHFIKPGVLQISWKDGTLAAIPFRLALSSFV